MGRYIMRTRFRRLLIPVSEALKGASEYHAHMAQWRASRVATPCAAWHRTFVGRCLNCGYDPSHGGKPVNGSDTEGRSVQAAGVNEPYG